MWGWLKRLWDRYKYLVISRPCERCGGPGASLVIDAVPAGKKVDGKTGLVTKTYCSFRELVGCRVGAGRPAHST